MTASDATAPLGLASPLVGLSDSRAVASTFSHASKGETVTDINDRLAEAVERVRDAIERGAAIRGHALPDGFALERARNIVAGLIDLFDPEAFR